MDQAPEVVDAPEPDPASWLVVEELLLFADALEGLVVGLPIHESACVRVTFRPVAGRRVENLAPVTNGPLAGPISIRLVLGHDVFVVCFWFRRPLPSTGMGQAFSP